MCVRLFNKFEFSMDLDLRQRYTYRVLQTIQMKLIILCVWAERAVLGSAKTVLKFKYKIQCMWQSIRLKSEMNNP